ncbi:PREDICTED: keratin-associated protein 19-2-like [Cariama cristata]|uniref:keratin-associated protein 19-2-like n=1 Tax=Cariama cristata TaxID=54380 RepID=UPI0005202FC8|nr:PREDICTED: keratin-associated protein 19-2-like [Cariama cristata]
MTFYRDLYDDGCNSPFGYEDHYGFGGLNDYRFGSPYGYYRDQYRYSSPYNYRSFGSLNGNRGLIGSGDHYGYGDFYGFGYGYPFSSHFGNRYSY